MKEIAIDGEIIKCKEFLVLNRVQKNILRILRYKPRTITEIAKLLSLKHCGIAQSTTSRNLQKLLIVGIVDYKLIDGRTKQFRVRCKI